MHEWHDGYPIRPPVTMRQTANMSHVLNCCRELLYLDLALEEQVGA